MNINLNNYTFFQNKLNTLGYLNIFTIKQKTYNIQEESNNFCSILKYLINNKIELGELKIEANLFYNDEIVNLFSHLINKNVIKSIHIITNTKIDYYDKYDSENIVRNFLKCFENLFKSIGNIVKCNLDIFIINLYPADFDINWPCPKPIIHINKLFKCFVDLFRKEDCKIKSLSFKYFSFIDVNILDEFQETDKNYFEELLNNNNCIEKIEFTPFCNNEVLDCLQIINKEFIEQLINGLKQNKHIRIISFPDLIIPYNENECKKAIENHEIVEIIEYTKELAHLFLPGLSLKIHYKNVISMKKYLLPKLLLSILYIKCFFSENTFLNLPIEIKYSILLYSLSFLNEKQITFICDELKSDPKKYKNNIIKKFNKTFIIDI